MDVEWKELSEIDLDATLSPEGYDLGDAQERETLRVGIRCRDAEMVDGFIERIKIKMRSKGAEILMMDYRNCSSTEDYQRRIVDTILEFIRSRYQEKLEKIKEGELNKKATDCLGLLGEKANKLRKNFLFVADFRGIKMEHSVLRPGQKFWWVYDAANRCEASNLIWLMDDNPEVFGILAEHGQMKRVFYENTYLFLII